MAGIEALKNRPVTSLAQVLSQVHTGAALNVQTRLLQQGKLDVSKSGLEKIAGDLNSLKALVANGSLKQADAENLMSQLFNKVNQQLASSGSTDRLTATGNNGTLPTIAVGTASAAAMGPVDLQTGNVDLLVDDQGNQELITPEIISSILDGAATALPNLTTPQANGVVGLTNDLAAMSTTQLNGALEQTTEQFQAATAAEPTRTNLSKMNEKQRKDELEKMFNDAFLGSIQSIFDSQEERNGEQTGGPKGAKGAKAGGAGAAAGAAAGGATTLAGSGPAAGATPMAGAEVADVDPDVLEGGGLYGDSKSQAVMDMIAGGGDPLTLAIALMILLVDQKGQDIRGKAEELKASMGKKAAAGKELNAAKEASNGNPDDPAVMAAESKKEAAGDDQTIIQLELQQLMAQYTEAVQNATAIIKSRHDAIQGVARNIA